MLTGVFTAKKVLIHAFPQPDMERLHPGAFQHLEQLESAALLQLLEHGAQVAPAAARRLHVLLKRVAPEQHARRVRKVFLEGEKVLRGHIPVRAHIRSTCQDHEACSGLCCTKHTQ